MALFGFGKKKEKPSCCCNASYTPEAMERAETAKRSAGIQVLGGGCANCHQLEANVKGALAELGLDTPVELITDLRQGAEEAGNRGCFAENSLDF